MVCGGVVVRVARNPASLCRLNMLGTLLRHEWRSLSADASIWLVVGVFTAAIAYGTFNGARWVAIQQRTIDQTLSEENERHRKHEAEIVRINRENETVSAFADPRNPDAVGRALGARYAVLPPKPLSPLAVGQSDLLPYYFKMTTDAKEMALAATEIENPHRLLAGRFDLAFVLIYLYPLLILALTYNLLSAEREQGTLVLALSQPVSLRRLVLGKVLLRLAVFLTAVIGLALVAALVVGVDLAASGALPQLGFWIVGVMLYGLFWFAIAVAVTALGKPSATNAMVLAGVWLVLVVLIPSALSMTATTMHPVPSRVEMIQAMRVASDDATAEGSTLLARYYEDHPELATGDTQQAMNDFNMVRVAVGAEVERRVRPVLARYAERLAAQQRVVERARFLSPAVLMQDALNDIAGTGAARHREFMRQVEDYHERWRAYFVRLIFQRARLADYSNLPRFTYEEESLMAVAHRVMVDFAGLVMPAVALLAAGLWRVQRYSVIA
jgi:ABC-2 type transport system permease protein